MRRLSNPYFLFGVWVVALAALPFVKSTYFVRLATNLAMFTILALSWNFIGGMTGYPSFSTAAFFGLGDYAGAITQNMGLPMGWAWLFATVLVGVLAALLGLILLRLRGHYFAIGSIAIVEILRLIIAAATDFTGGGSGLNVRFLAGGPEYVDMVFLFVMLSLMVLVLAITVWVDKSKFGFGLQCIRQNEAAADMIGINSTFYKISAYVLSTAFCGIAGAIFASWSGYIDPTDSFEILLTLKVPVMAMLGGAGTVMWPVLGTAVFQLLEEVFWANFSEYNRAILGVVIVVLIFFLPDGLLRLKWDYQSLWLRLRRYAGRTTSREPAA